MSDTDVWMDVSMPGVLCVCVCVCVFVCVGVGGGGGGLAAGCWVTEKSLLFSHVSNLSLS